MINSRILCLLIFLLFFKSASSQTMTYFGGRIKKEGVTIGTKAKVIINSTYDTYKFVL